MSDQSPFSYWFHSEQSFSSESAYVFIGHCIQTNHQQMFWAEGEEVALKILKEYKDIRFNHWEQEKRRNTQKEALQFNRLFTPDVYIGIAPLIEPQMRELSSSTSQLRIGEIITDADKLSQNSFSGQEYVLVMKRLPNELRLDMLWRDEQKREQTLHLLLERIVHMHTQPIPPQTISAVQPWGCIEQICSKLDHNIELFKAIPLDYQNLDTDLYARIRNLLTTLRKDLSTAQYRSLFEQRVNEQRIMRCHGDLKCTNIWVLPSEFEQSALIQVKILDAIDFNHQYSVIDILSDFAMLVVDLLAHTIAQTQEASIVKDFINDYLKATGQQGDEIAEAVLRYYLFEKAIVCASVEAIAPEYDSERTEYFYKQFLKIALSSWEQL